MGRNIIEKSEGFQISVNTFWNGDEECVQVTTENGYFKLTRVEARRFFLLAYNRLSSQVVEDEENPPWWQRRKSK